MKEAIKDGYGEPLAWFGPSYESPKRYEIFTTDGNIKLNCSRYIIHNTSSDISELGEDTYSKVISIKLLTKGEYRSIDIELLGIRETFQQLKKNYILAVPSLVKLLNEVEVLKNGEESQIIIGGGDVKNEEYQVQVEVSTNKN
ncbi:12431_t:CDS:2 [Ambispora gerdemannii]|uniref:12431_t:CDS:1 n=1 Tax=Ambispora gerdemannii TaxID=144530 RepID=A0A9N9AA32_9GLOM|nr:12431_t:CDS:2 [Ambispora gerdemannii]